MLADVLLSFLVFEHGFIQIRFSIFEFFTRYLFSINIIFFIDEKRKQ